MKNLLVLTDFSQSAFSAALYAAALTHQLECSKIILYHSYGYRSTVPTALSVPQLVGIEALHQESVDALTELKDKLLPFTNERTFFEIVTDGRPLLLAAESILLQYQAGLIVMGITGKSRLEQAVMGSNTIIVAKESLFPVLLIPVEAVFEKIRRVVFACDLKNVSSSLPIKEIKSLIHDLKANLMVLNVDTEEAANFTPDTIDEQRQLHQLWDQETPQYYYATDNNIAAGIKKFTIEHSIQWVIAVPKQHNFFEGLFHSSLTKRLTFNTSIPLLLMKKNGVRP